MERALLERRVSLMGQPEGLRDVVYDQRRRRECAGPVAVRERICGDGGQGARTLATLLSPTRCLLAVRAHPGSSTGPASGACRGLPTCRWSTSTITATCGHARSSRGGGSWTSA